METEDNRFTQIVKRHKDGMLKEFSMHWKNYVLQCMLATATVWIVLMLLQLRNAVIIASIGATAFIIFAMPRNIVARSRNVLGGYIVGIVCGSLCSLIPHEALVSSSLVYASAVGLSIFIMVVIDTEHPPASGTALGFAIEGFDQNVVITVMASVLILSLARHLFKKYLRDLT